MAGTFTQKFLAEGQLANAEAALYTVPAATKTLIKTVILSNVGGADRTFNILVKKGAGTSRTISQKNQPLVSSDAFTFSFNIMLEAGDTIRGYADAATAIDYTIFGVEET